MRTQRLATIATNRVYSSNAHGEPVKFIKAKNSRLTWPPRRRANGPIQVRQMTQADYERMQINAHA